MIARNYYRNVFINGLFDPAYRPLFEAIAFATSDCGYHPRCSLEVDDSSQVRIEKITTIIRESRLAVHDICRTQLDRGTRLPRFNMPLELGIFLGVKSFGSRADQEKVAIILAPTATDIRSSSPTSRGRTSARTAAERTKRSASCATFSRPTFSRGFARMNPSLL